MKVKWIASLFAAMAIGGAASQVATAHPNLKVSSEVTCEAVKFSVTGIDQKSYVYVTTNAKINGVDSVLKGKVKDSDTQPFRVVELPNNFVGTVEANISSEKRTSNSGVLNLDCRTPVPPVTPPPVPEKPEVIPPPAPPPPPPTCAELKARYPKAGKVRLAQWGCPVPPVVVKPKICERPTTININQPGPRDLRPGDQRAGFYFTETYRGYATIKNTTGQVLRNVKVQVKDGLYQRFIRQGQKVKSFGLNLPNMKPGGSVSIGWKFGFTGPEAYKKWFTTVVSVTSGGVPCGAKQDTRFEG